MSWQIRDLRCVECDVVERGVACNYNEYRPCPECGGDCVMDFSGGQAFYTDVFGQPTYSDATGLEHSSQREKIAHMRKNGYDEAGDKVGGARHEHRINGTGFSFPGQQRRRTLAEGR